jgi:hypothetical protein
MIYVKKPSPTRSEINKLLLRGEAGNRLRSFLIGWPRARGVIDRIWDHITDAWMVTGAPAPIIVSAVHSGVDAYRQADGTEAVKFCRFMDTIAYAIGTHLKANALVAGDDRWTVLSKEPLSKWGRGRDWTEIAIQPDHRVEMVLIRRYLVEVMAEAEERQIWEESYGRL